MVNPIDPSYQSPLYYRPRETPGSCEHETVKTLYDPLLEELASNPKYRSLLQKVLVYQNTTNINYINLETKPCSHETTGETTNAVPRQLERFWDAAGGDPVTKEDLQRMVQDPTLSVQYRLLAREMIDSFSMFSGGDCQINRQEFVKNTPELVELYNKLDGEMRADSAALQPIVEDKKLFEQLAMSLGCGQGGDISREELKHVIDNPGDYDPKAVAAASVLLDKFEQVNTEGNYISHQEIVDFQEKLLEETGTTVEDTAETQSAVNTVPPQLDKFWQIAGDGPIDQQDLQKIADSPDVLIQYRLLAIQMLDNFNAFSGGDDQISREEFVKTTPELTASYNKLDGEMRTDSEAIKPVLEDPKLFAQLDSAAAKDGATDGKISKQDLENILANPDKYDPKVVKAAQVLSDKFDLIQAGGDGLINHQELVDFQKKLAQETGTSEANVVQLSQFKVAEPQIVDNEKFKSAEAMDVVLKNKDFFSMLDGAGTSNALRAMDGLIGRKDLEAILKNPDKYPPEVVEAAKTLSENFDKADTDGNGVISREELSRFQNKVESEARPVVDKDKGKIADSIDVVLESSFFTMLDGAGTSNAHRATDGLIGRKDLEAILKNPDKYPSEVVETAKALSSNFDKVDADKNGVISREELSKFQSQLKSEARNEIDTSEVKAAAVPEPLDLKKGSVSIKAVLEDHDLFGQLESAWPKATGWDGEIGRGDLEQIINNPNKYPPEVVNAAKVLSENFDKADTGGDGMISHKELVEYQKTIAKETNTTLANPDEPRIIKKFDMGDRIWRSKQMETNEKLNATIDSENIDWKKGEGTLRKVLDDNNLFHELDGAWSVLKGKSGGRDQTDQQISREDLSKVLLNPTKFSPEVVEVARMIMAHGFDSIAGRDGLISRKELEAFQTELRNAHLEKKE